MSASDIEYDVYATPRMGAIELGDFAAADGKERETILRSAKYSRRTHRARAWYARQEIVNYLTAPRRSLGDIDAAIEAVKADAEGNSGGKQEDAMASVDCLKKFLGFQNQIDLTGKDVVGLDDEHKTLDIEGVEIWFAFDALIRSVSKSGEDRVGGIFLNTRLGKGLGSQPATVEKRKKAGETVALIALRQLIDVYSDFGEPYPKDTYHVYVRAQHFWCAPASYVNRMKNLEAEARAVAMMWPAIAAPSDFDPAKAKFHS
jgi:hypothetical protein